MSHTVMVVNLCGGRVDRCTHEPKQPFFVQPGVIGLQDSNFRLHVVIEFATMQADDGTGGGGVKQRPCHG